MVIFQSAGAQSGHDIARKNSFIATLNIFTYFFITPIY